MNKEKIKIIFLDFDGVLNNSTWTYYKYKSDFGKISKWADNSAFDPINIATFQRLIDSVPDAYVVFSTSWKWSRSVDSLIQLLKKAGLDIDENRYLGKTPDLFGHFAFSRADEINKFLDEFEFNHPDKEIDSYAILDDVDIKKNLSNNWVQTNMDWGLTLADVEDAIFLLTINDPDAFESNVIEGFNIGDVFNG